MDSVNIINASITNCYKLNLYEFHTKLCPCNLNPASFTDLAEPSGRQRTEDEGGHTRGWPEAGEVMIHKTGDGHLALNIILRESLLDIFWSDLIARPIHQRVSVLLIAP